jgi:hypothetical protein
MFLQIKEKKSLIFYSEMKQEWAREEYISLLYKEREKWAGLVQDWYLEAERHEKRI